MEGKIQHREKDRQSQSGYGKETSKNGAGGKFTWGAPGDEAHAAPMDRGDPNYDLDAEVGDKSESELIRMAREQEAAVAHHNEKARDDSRNTMANPSGTGFESQ